MNVTAFDKRADHNGGTADVVYVFGSVFSGGAEIANQRRARKYLPDIVDREGYAGFIGKRRQMQRGVGRAARGSDNGRTVLQSLPRDDFARQWPAPFKHPHNPTAPPPRNL